MFLSVTLRHDLLILLFFSVSNLFKLCRRFDIIYDQPIRFPVLVKFPANQTVTRDGRDWTFTVKFRTAVKALVVFFNLCLSVIIVNRVHLHSYPFFLTRSDHQTKGCGFLSPKITTTFCIFKLFSFENLI